MPARGEPASSGESGPVSVSGPLGGSGPPTEPEPEPLWQERDGVKVLSPLHARAFLGLLRAGQEVDAALDAGLQAAHGVSLRGFEVLLHLVAFLGGSARIGSLVDRLPLSQSRTSRLVVDLERAGLVARSPDDDDGRAVRVTVTDAGRRLFQAAQETHLADLERRMFGRLSWDQVVSLGEITTALLREPTTDGRRPPASP